MNPSRPCLAVGAESPDGTDLARLGIREGEGLRNGGCPASPGTTSQFQVNPGVIDHREDVS